MQAPKKRSKPIEEDRREIARLGPTRGQPFQARAYGAKRLHVYTVSRDGAVLAGVRGPALVVSVFSSVPLGRR